MNQESNITITNTPLELQLSFIGFTVKKLRKMQGLTQSQLGERIGVKKATVCQIEKGEGNFTLGTVDRVFKALNARFSISIDAK